MKKKNKRKLEDRTKKKRGQKAILLDTTGTTGEFLS